MPQLNHESKTAFLKHILWRDAQKDKRPRASQKFLKYFTISKDFLNASRPKDVSRVVLRTDNVNLYETEESNDLVNICIIPSQYALDVPAFYSSFQDALRLLQLLKPQLLQLQLNDGMPNEQIIAYGDLVEQLKAQNLLNKLAIILLGHNQSKYEGLIRKFSDQINELECDIKSMIIEDLYPSFDLDLYVARKMRNFAQLKPLLKRHKMKKLKLDMYSQFFNGNPNEQLDLTPEEHESARHVRFLELEHRRDHARLKLTVEKLLQLFPNLVSLHVTSISNTDAHDMEDFYDELNDLYELTSKLQQNCKEKVQKVTFEVMLRGFCKDHDSMAKMFKKHPKFKDFTFFHSYYLLDNHSLSNVFKFIDHNAKMTFRTWVTFQSISDYDNEVRYQRLGRGAPRNQLF